MNSGSEGRDMSMSGGCFSRSSHSLYSSSSSESSSSFTGSSCVICFRLGWFVFCGGLVVFGNGVLVGYDSGEVEREK